MVAVVVAGVVAWALQGVEPVVLNFHVQSQVAGLDHAVPESFLEGRWVPDFRENLGMAAAAAAAAHVILKVLRVSHESRQWAGTGVRWIQNLDGTVSPLNLQTVQLDLAVA